MPAPSTFSSLAARLFSSAAIREQQQQRLCHPRRPSSSYESHTLLRCCFSSKAKDKAKGKSGSAEKEAPPPPAAEKKSSSKKPHWSQQVFYKVSARLVPILDCKEATRPEAIERMWDYIKTNNLQARPIFLAPIRPYYY